MACGGAMPRAAVAPLADVACLRYWAPREEQRRLRQATATATTTIATSAQQPQQAPLLTASQQAQQAQRTGWQPSVGDEEVTYPPLHVGKANNRRMQVGRLAGWPTGGASVDSHIRNVAAHNVTSLRPPHTVRRALIVVALHRAHLLSVATPHNHATPTLCNYPALRRPCPSPHTRAHACCR